MQNDSIGILTLCSFPYGNEHLFFEGTINWFQFSDLLLKTEQEQNNMKKILASFLVIGFLLMGTSCNRAANPIAASSTNSKTTVSADASYKVTDSLGKEVTFSKAPNKIISLLPSDTEIIYALGEGDKLIAVDTYSNYPEEAKKKQQLDSGDKTNIEAIIGLKPDLVILGEMAQTESQFKQLEDAGIKVVVTEAGDIAQTYKVIEMMGKTLNKSAKAAEIINGMKNDFEQIKAKVKNNPPKKVYIEISPLKYKLWSCGKGTFQDELLTLIGATNIFSDISSWKEVSEEQVLSRNPQIIITTVGPMYGIADPVSEIKGRANWNEIDAVKNGKVFVTDSDAIQRPGPRLATAAKDLVKIIYG
jgi:iron complex transport system substrate-binding protein